MTCRTDVSVDKSIGCSCSGHRFSSQHPYGSSSPRRPNSFFLGSLGTRCEHGTYNMQTEHLCTLNKINEPKFLNIISMRWGCSSEEVEHLPGILKAISSAAQQVKLLTRGETSGLKECSLPLQDENGCYFSLRC